MADNFFNSLFKRNIIAEPENVKEAFFKKFPDAINIEWVKIENVYEAIFYEHETEKIARFLENSSWIETMTNLDITVLDGKTRKAAEQHGEIMSSIEIENSDKRKYEIIVRDKQLKRFLLIISSLGEVLSNIPIS